MHLPIKRSGTDYVIAGVLGGLADYLNWNSNLLRVFWLIFSLTAFPGILAYLVLWLLMKKPKVKVYRKSDPMPHQRTGH